MLICKALIVYLLLIQTCLSSNVNYFRLKTRKLSSKISLSSKASKYYPMSPYGHKNTISDPTNLTTSPIGENWDEIMGIFGKFMKDYFLSISPKVIPEVTISELKDNSKTIYKEINRLLLLIQDNFSTTPSVQAILPVRSPLSYERNGILLDILISIKVRSDLERVPFRAALVKQLRENHNTRALFFSMYKDTFWIIKTRFKMEYGSLNHKIIKATKKFNDVSTANESYDEVIKLAKSINNLITNKHAFCYTEVDLNTQDTDSSFADVSRQKSFEVHGIYSRVKSLKMSIINKIDEFSDALNDIQETHNEQINKLTEIDVVKNFLNKDTFQAIKQAITQNTKNCFNVHNSMTRANLADFHQYSIEAGKETETDIDNFLHLYNRKMKELINNFRLLYKRLLRVYYLIEIQENIISDGFVIKQKLKETSRFRRL
eukprot:GAHX01001732.1.p1 GENE.GAHX01001732.1~~GAHX01001732.1.p1  ORF type:complete len:432 (-),score=67.45 GAHX01001732.1:39-1334(-)